MRYVRYRLDERVCWGVIEAARHDEHVTQLSHAPWHVESRPIGKRHRLTDVRLLAPVEPSKIAAVGRNYADHAIELGSPTTEEPRIFFKPPTSVIGPSEQIILPPVQVTNEVHYEAELAVVIGKQCRYIAPADARRVIFGYTCANDVTARDVQRRNGLPDYAKSFDTFCPLGPWIKIRLDLASTRVRCLLNGEMKQNGRVGDMLTPVPALISYISQAMTLLPGDVILTGTPAGVGQIVAGDEVAVDIDGLGTLISLVATHNVPSGRE
jgi:2-keto-4-pentenoate hydratase/2-oxohepta-3-ene-1,7-dioic acid hydratase in catechol pathway